jgi:hypothetical protein
MTLQQDGVAHMSPSAASSGAQGASSAERMRLTRQRRRQGLRCLVIEIREREISALIRRKRLSPDDRANLGAIRQALYGFLDDYLE